MSLKLLNSASARVRSAHPSYSLAAVCALSVVYVGLYLVVFISYTWALLLLVALTPFALALCGARNGVGALGVVGLASAVLWFFGNLFYATYNWAAVLALALLHAGIIVACGASLRWWYRATRIPLALLLPITFVAGEFLRLLGPLGVPTGLLALSFHKQLWMIQIADLGGIDLVSFAIASVNGALADVLLAASAGDPLAVGRLGQTPARPSQRRWRFTETPYNSVAGVAVLWIGIACYGAFRLHESQQTMQPGPIVGVVQSDIPMTGGIENGFDSHLFLEEMLALSAQSAASNPPPQLIVWPETMAVVPPLNSEWLQTKNVPAASLRESEEFERALRDWTTRAGIPLLVGTRAIVPLRDNPKAVDVYNSAIRFDPGLGQNSQRQDKQRLFPLAEFIPWRGTFIHTLLERWLAPHSSVPWSGGWYARGEQRQVFELRATSAANAPLHYAISMCVELCYAESCGTFLRNAHGGKAADFFVNMSNDGIFQRNRAQVWHAAMSSFRAVEARVGIARSSNTGISGFVKPTGEMYGEVVNTRGQSWTGLGAPELSRIAALVKFRREHADELATNPALAAHVTSEIAAIEELRRAAGVSGQSTQRLYVDSRRTLYSRIGDLFPWLLVIFTGAGFLPPFGQIARRARSAGGPEKSLMHSRSEARNTHWGAGE
jgi:apolipoprotein N-acyltransferase